LKQCYFITISLFLAIQVSLPAQQKKYQRAFSVAFENDMFNKMDWYGLALRQELFTPRDLEDDTIRAGDHPYAATLTLTQQRVVNRPEIGIRFTSGLRVGILGPAALGFFAQDIIHRITPSNPPKGWDYQVHNDVILNYDFMVDKEVLRDDISIFGVKGEGRLGTLHNDFSGGIWFRLELGQAYFEHLGPSPDNPFNLYFQMEGTGRLVVYDATLQGGIFNKTSPYVIPSESVNRLVGDINMSLVFEVRGHQLGLYQHLISSRFTDSGWHGWLGINYTYWR
jgi:lipid A 3-O-deacylase